MKRAPKPRVHTMAELEELDALIADQRAEDNAWISRHHNTVSLDAVLGDGEDGDVTMRDLLIDMPDYTPFGFMRVLMEQRDLVRTQRRRRKVGWRLTDRKNARRT